MKPGALLPTLVLGTGAAVLLTLGSVSTANERAFVAASVPVTGRIIDFDANGCPRIALERPEGGTWRMWSSDCSEGGDVGDRVPVLWNAGQHHAEVRSFTVQWLNSALLLGFGVLVLVAAVVASQIAWVPTDRSNF